MNSGPAACIIGAVITIALVFAAQSAAAAIPSSPEIAGRVVEAGTGKPIAGALVTGHIGGGKLRAGGCAPDITHEAAAVAAAMRKQDQYRQLCDRITAWQGRRQQRIGRCRHGLGVQNGHGQLSE